MASVQAGRRAPSVPIVPLTGPDFWLSVATPVLPPCGAGDESTLGQSGTETHFKCRAAPGGPAHLAASLPGLAEVGAPTVTAIVGRAARFRTGKAFRSFTGPAPRASETGETGRKSQPMSKAGNRQLRTTLVRAADSARRVDPQLAQIYYIQMIDRGGEHLKACRVVAAHLAERLHAVLVRGMPYVICDIDGTPVDPATAKRIIAEHWAVPLEVRARRRSRKSTRPPDRTAGKASAWVFLVGDRAYKLKEPLDLEFLDFRDRAARERACRAEVALNRRLAPGSTSALPT